MSLLRKTFCGSCGYVFRHGYLPVYGNNKLYKNLSSLVKQHNQEQNASFLSLLGIMLQPINIQQRFYAKGAKGDKGKGDGKKQSGSKVTLPSEEVAKIVDIEKMKQQMELALTQQQNEYLTQLSLRTSTGSLDNLPVETKDGRFPLMQLGQVTAKTPQLMIINMASMPQYITEVKEAILKSGMNLNPQQDGTSLFVPIPMVTREHRENLSKTAKSISDKTKEKLRDLHNRFERDVRKSKDKFSADRVREVEQLLLATQRDYMQQSERLYEAKKSELLGSTKS